MEFAQSIKRIKELAGKWPKSPQPKKRSFPSCATDLSDAQARDGLMYYSQLFASAHSVLGVSKANLKIFKTELDNEVRFVQIEVASGGKKPNLSQVEREVKVENEDLIKKIAYLEAKVAYFESLLAGYQVLKEAYSREITFRTAHVKEY